MGQELLGELMTNEQAVEARIAELQKGLDLFVQEAQRRIAYTEGQIAELQRLLDPLPDEQEIPDEA